MSASHSACLLVTGAHGSASHYVGLLKYWRILSGRTPVVVVLEGDLQADKRADLEDATGNADYVIQGHPGRAATLCWQ